MMNISELNNQLAPYLVVNDQQYEKLKWYLNELLKWNRKINLTSIVDIDQCWEKHIVDSLLASCFIQGNERLLDIGSGAGFPSIPLKIVCGELNIDSVDSVSKKISFQRHCIRHLGVVDFRAHAKRIESMDKELDRQFDVVVSRAFTSLDQFIEIAEPFITASGKIIAMKGSAAKNEVVLAADTLKRLKLSIVRQVEIDLVPSESKRVLIEIKRTATSNFE